MKCPKCGKKWTFPGKDASAFMFCPYCQNPLEPSPEWFDSVSDGICYVIMTCGSEPYEPLKNKEFLKNSLCDVLGENYKNRTLIETAIKCGIGDVFYHANHKGKNEQITVYHSALQLLENKAYYNHEKAVIVVDYFMKALGWHIPEGKQRPIYPFLLAASGCVILLIAVVLIATNKQSVSQSAITVPPLPSDSTETILDSESTTSTSVRSTTEPENADTSIKEIVLENVVYQISGGNAAVVGISGSPKTIVIQEKIDDMIVSSIMPGAFQDAVSIESAVIPASITCIPENAFSNCINLQSISLPNSLQEIGKYAFDHCHSLTNITIPDSVKLVDDYAFWICESLETMTVLGKATVLSQSMMRSEAIGDSFRIRGYSNSSAEAYAKLFSIYFDYLDKNLILSSMDAVKSVYCSSQLEDIDTKNQFYNYSPWNLLDSDLSTCWCEGQSNGGEGDEIVIEFNDEYDIDSITIYNGLETSKELYYANSRIKTATIWVTEETSYSFELAESWDKRVQHLKLPKSIHTDQIRIVINSVYQGQKYNDTCVSEIEVQ